MLREDLLQGSWLILTVLEGIVHVIDHILDPASQVFERDLPKLTQSFIAGSCSNTALAYC